MVVAEANAANHHLQSDLTKDITTSVLTVNNKAHMVTLDYTVQVPGTGQSGSPDLRYPPGKAGGWGGRGEGAETTSPHGWSGALLQ